VSHPVKAVGERLARQTLALIGRAGPGPRAGAAGTPPGR